MKKTPLVFSVPMCLLVLSLNFSYAQQYKIRQASTMMGMKSESTIYVKGMRKRTEPPTIMGMFSPITIEQCDRQRVIKLNDKKKLYYIEPFAKDAEEVIDEDQKAVPVKTKPVPAANTTPQKGGIINMWYTITDTGERKKMHGFTARHVWTYQKTKPSEDACYMKDSMIMKTDGWYIDFPEFNCPVKYRPATGGPAAANQPECKDRYVTRRKGKGKLGFPLIEKRTVQMGAQASEFETNIETIELSTAKLDSMLFEIPPGYTEVKSESELQEKFDMADIINQAKQNAQNQQDQQTTGEMPKKPSALRIGVFEPKGDAQVSPADLQRDLALLITRPTVEGVIVSSLEDAKSKNCDYTLSTDFVKFKQASKIGGLIKAVKNTDPNAATSFNIEASMVLTKLADGSTKAQPKVSGKYDGRPEIAAKKVLEEGSGKILDALNL